MEAIDLALFNFSPRAGLAVAVMVGFLVFAVALDLTGPTTLGVWAARSRRAAQPILTTVGLIQTVPSLALLAFLIPLLDASCGQDERHGRLCRCELAGDRLGNSSPVFRLRRCRGE